MDSLVTTAKDCCTDLLTRAVIERMLRRVMESFPAQAHSFFQDWKARRRSINILVIGDCGSGKTTLVNNLLGEEIAQEQAPSILSTFQGVFQGVSVKVHETSGLENPDAEGDTEFKKDMRSLLRGGKIDLVIYCLKATETRMRDSLINSLQRYHNMGLDWRKTVIALTFADVLPIPRHVRQERPYDPARYFNARVAEWKQTLAQTLTSRIGVSIGLAGELKVVPTTGNPAEELLNHEKWFGQMWSNVVDAIKAAPSTSLQGSIALAEQPRPGTSTSSYQQSRNQTPPARSEGSGSGGGVHSGNDACCSAESVCSPFKTAFDDCISTCCNAVNSVCKFVYTTCCKSSS